MLAVDEAAGDAAGPLPKHIFLAGVTGGAAPPFDLRAPPMAHQAVESQDRWRLTERRAADKLAEAARCDMQQQPVGGGAGGIAPQSESMSM